MIGSKADIESIINGEVLPYSTIGTDRVVYLVRNVIYKFDISNHPANEYENEALDYLKSVPLLPCIALPRHRLINFDNNSVMAMEFVNGVETGECSARWTGLGYCEDNNTCMSDDIVDHLNKYGVNDLAEGNVIVRDTKYYLIDTADTDVSAY